MADGVFYAELNELLTRELAEDGYSGVEVRVTPMRTEIIIKATRTQNVLGERPGWGLHVGSRHEGKEERAADCMDVSSIDVKQLKSGLAGSHRLPPRGGGWHLAFCMGMTLHAWYWGSQARRAAASAS